MKYVIDKEKRPVYLQLYNQIREDIVNDILRFDSKLPSIRALAEEFADVMMYGLQLARTLGIDITGQVLRKIDIVDRRPPKAYDPKR